MYWQWELESMIEERFMLDCEIRDMKRHLTRSKK